MPTDKLAPLLMVDDDPIIRDVIGRMLKRAGIPFDSAAEGMSAFQKAHDRARAGAPYQLIITDILMPVWDGITMIKAIDVVSPTTRVLVQSSYLDRNLHQRLADCPSVLATFQKPFDVSEFFDAIVSALNSPAKTR